VVLYVKKMAVFILVLAGLLLLTSCGAEKPQETNQVEEEQGVLVEQVEVEQKEISNITAVNGKLAANIEVSIIPKMAGKVAEVIFDVGDEVHKGDVLVRLESTELQAQLKQAQAGLATAKANYADAQKNLERTKSLFEQGAVSQQQLDLAQTQLAMGSPDSAAAAVQLIQAQLANTVITSPIDGIVSARSVEVGEIAGQGPVMTIVDVDQVIVETNVTESEVNKIEVGQVLDVKVSALQDEPFKGTVSTISPAADSRTGAFPIKITIPNSIHQLKPGMFAEVKLVLETKIGALVVPKEAVIDSGDRKYVFKIVDDKAVMTDVTTGMSDETHMEVLIGLAAGDKVVTKGQNKLQDNTPVMTNGGTK